MPLFWFLAVFLRHLWNAFSNSPSGPMSRFAELTEALGTVQLLIVKGEHRRAGAMLESLRTHVDQIQGEDGRILRARHGLLVGEMLGLMERREEARKTYEGVHSELQGLPMEPRIAHLGICVDVGRGLLVAPGETTGEDMIAGERALAREAEVDRSDTLMKMTRLSNWLGIVHQNSGHWEQARARFEQAVRIAERFQAPGGGDLDFSWSSEARLLFGTDARLVASASAIELGLTWASLGEFESGRAWFEKAVSILEGLGTPQVQVQMAKALLVLAQRGFRGGIEDEVKREALLERAVDTGLKSDRTLGRVFACQAEVARGVLDSSRGMTEAAAAHYRRAAGYLDGVSGPGADEFAAQALLTLGLELAGAGKHAEAIAAFRQALARGRESPDFDARRHAALSAYHLHHLLLKPDAPGDAGPVLDTLDALVPTLVVDVRPLYVALATRCRGWQHLCEKRPLDARRELERVESRSRELGTPDGWNLARQAASDLGFIAMEDLHYREAVEHLERAAAIPLGQTVSGREQADLAQVELRLARALIEVDREGEALETLQRALDRGRDSGLAEGRETAAVAAMVMGDRAEVSTGQRRRWYELAANLGQTSGSPGGRQIVDAVTERLREMAE